MMNAPVILVVACASVALCGCGFQLAGAGDVPNVLATTYVQTTTPNSEFYDSLRDTLRSRGLEVVGTPEQARARLIISEDSTGQRVLSVSARNTPEEFEVFYVVDYSIDRAGEEVVPTQTLELTRSFSFDEADLLAKDREEDILREAMARDIAGLVVRRLSSL